MSSISSADKKRLIREYKEMLEDLSDNLNSCVYYIQCIKCQQEIFTGDLLDNNNHCLLCRRDDLRFHQIASLLSNFHGAEGNYSKLITEEAEQLLEEKNKMIKKTNRNNKDEIIRKYKTLFNTRKVIDDIDYMAKYVNRYRFDGYNYKGFSIDGYNREGYDEGGYHKRDGLDINGFAEDGVFYVTDSIADRELIMPTEVEYGDNILFDASEF